MDVIQHVPDGYSILIREHPLHIGLYDPFLYKLIEKSKFAYIDNKTPLNQIIDDSALVVVNNSTAGLDAMRRNKTVVVLGNAYYANDNVVYKLKTRSDLGQLFASAIKDPINPIFIQRHLAWIMNECLILGHYHDKNLSNAKFVIKKILSQCGRAE
jgi:capsular polysaccharide export protein